MKFEYNGNLLEEQRVMQVAKEIARCYPMISIDKAISAASMEEKISTNVNLEMVFNRLYNILAVNQDDINSSKMVYTDLLSYIMRNKNDEKYDYYYSIALEISNYLVGKRDFPYLNEFVEN